MNILFVCTGNTCRSPMAKALLEDMAQEKGIDINVKSAGIYALDGQSASKGAIEALKVEGIDIETHRASIIYKDLLEWADLILTMGISHKEILLSKYDFIRGKVYTLKEYAYDKEENVRDPFGGDIHIYNNTKEEIKEALKYIIRKTGGDIDENRYR